jgi:agmatinase
MLISLENKKISGSDVVELNPSFDNGSTASLAAKMISTIIAMNIK